MGICWTPKLFAWFILLINAVAPVLVLLWSANCLVNCPLRHVLTITSQLDTFPLVFGCAITHIGQSGSQCPVDWPCYIFWQQLNTICTILHRVYLIKCLIRLLTKLCSTFRPHILCTQNSPGSEIYINCSSLYYRPEVTHWAGFNLQIGSTWDHLTTGRFCKHL